MSRVGKKPIEIPNGVKATIDKHRITIEGPKGLLSHTVPSQIKVELSDSRIVAARQSDSKEDKSLHGLTRTIISNMIRGTTVGYTKTLEIEGVGFRAQVQGKILNLQLGRSHPILFPIPEGITIEVPKPTQIVVSGIDKAKVGEVAAKIRSFYPPEPYKGKGIRYVGEFIRRKAGKTVGVT